MPSTPLTYSRVQLLLHWAIAAMVIFQVLVNSDISRAYHAVHNNTTPSVSTVLWANIHIWIGLAILVFATWLVTLRWTRGVPPVRDGKNRFHVCGRAWYKNRPLWVDFRVADNGHHRMVS